MAVLIKNALVVNADRIAARPQDILVDEGRIKKIGPGLSADGAQVIDAAGRQVWPGLIDLHTHLREPGREDKETIATGCRAAARGGFTTIFCMPNTDPVLDNAMLIESVIREARRVGLAQVIPVGAITKGQRGEVLTDMFELQQAGCLALSDDGKAVNNSLMMRLAMDYSRMTGLRLMEHCQDPLLSSKGVMNEGYTATLLGMRGDPAVSEIVIVARDLELSRYLDVGIHLQHISAARSVELIRQAKQDGVRVTAEACPHHFSLTEEAVKTFDPNTKVNPPLRTAADVAAVKAGLRDGTIDCIATDHAPHTVEDKEMGFDLAPFGMIGLETALGLAITELVGTEGLTLPQLVDRMSAAPARMMGLTTKGVIAEGRDADLIIVDPDAEWVVRAEDFASKARNSPFIGLTLRGQVLTTICAGRVVYEAASAGAGK